MRSPILTIVEHDYKAASGEAAFYELRLRLLAGTISTISVKPIDIPLSKLLDAIVEHYGSLIKDDDAKLLKKACYIRNKLLHCEFSSARQHLNELSPKKRVGGVIRLDTANLDAATIVSKINDVATGHDVGQVSVSVTNTKTLKDIVGWLLECQGANEFNEAINIFQDACVIIDHLGGNNQQTFNQQP